MNLRPSGYEPDKLPSCSTPRYICFMCSSVSTVNNTLRTFHSFIWMTASFSLRLLLANRSDLSGRKHILAVRETARTNKKGVDKFYPHLLFLYLVFLMRTKRYDTVMSGVDIPLSC